ncbi:hypothetical protein EIN_065380 [Entamoeba invadens IP1]|uniref:Leucine-rich repeat containing protein n=1 Tax=Entamoeba invadens IP1 TaxID=370355 RepID=A0A0A1U054_ENTIV|nr:hypothetical protein EIN_065380 [Entamoeba invadens IP1]ELP84273.1 hypothetical protein EIN_065380 [Entamoeba invadens IP1]|eukprot:XP_004183619.1 hypothetical protein EIN_065380 [Entamoeba invadens IP1]
MNIFKKKATSRPTSPSLPPHQKFKRSSCGIASTKSSDIPFETIALYFTNVTDATRLMKVNRSVRACYYIMKKNPYYCQSTDSSYNKETIFQKELLLFPNIEILRCDVDVVKKLDARLIRKVTTIELVGKFIYAPPGIFQKIQNSISSFGFYLDENLNFTFDTMHFLQTLHIDVNNNTEMIYFNKFMFSTIQSIQQLPCFQRIFIECNGDDLFKLQEILTKFYSTRITCVLYVHNLRENHINNISELLKKKNVVIAIYENELSASFDLPELKLLFLNNNKLAFVDSMLFSDKLKELCVSHYVPRLDICGFKVGLNPKIPEIDFSQLNSLQEFRLINSFFEKPFSFIFPTSLTRLEITTSAYFGLPNLPEIPLQEFCVYYCDSVRSFYVPPTAKLVEISHCNAVTGIPNLEEVPLEQLVIIECPRITTLKSSNKLKTLKLYWCDKLQNLSLANGLEQLDIFYNKGLKNLRLPTTLKILDLNFCNNLTQLDNVQEVRNIIPVELRHKFLK